MDVYCDFPRRLRQLREQRRISRRVLADLCGLSRSALARYERGERKPTVDAVVALSDFFGTSVDDLLGRK